MLELLFCMLLRCMYGWKYDSVAVTALLAALASAVTTLHILLSFWFFYLFLAILEYIMLYNMIYKLHRINLCHLRHMNFTVYAHFKSAKRIFLLCFVLIFGLIWMNRSIRHFALINWIATSKPNTNRIFVQCNSNLNNWWSFCFILYRI